MNYYTPVRVNSIPRLPNRTKIFISFSYKYDKHYRYLMKGWNANSSFKFIYDDRTPNEIQTDSVSRVKAVLTTKIKEASVVAVLIGSHANELHPDWREIGHRNWQNFEVAKAKELNRKLVAIQINALYDYPEELLDAGAARVYSFNQEDLIKAIRG